MIVYFARGGAGLGPAAGCMVLGFFCHSHSLRSFLHVTEEDEIYYTENDTRSGTCCRQPLISSVRNDFSNFEGTVLVCYVQAIIY